MLNQSLLPELQHEAASTRKMLQQVPFEKWNWAPHEKSMTLGQLANHVADLVSWVPLTLRTEQLDFSNTDYRALKAESKDHLMQSFDEAVATALADLQSAGDEALMMPWSLRNGEQVFFTLPRVAVLRTMVMNHLIHHRGQLSVYLRLLGVPVPGMYGPSADDASF